jgi:hypothetical protein
MLELASRLAALTLLDAKVGYLIKLLFLFRGKLIVMGPDGVPADQFAIIHKNPVGDLIRVHRNKFADFHPMDLSWGVVYPALKAVSTELHVRKPKVLHLVALPESLFYLKVLLARRRMLQGGDKGTDGFPRLEDRAVHLGMIILNVEIFRLGVWPLEFLPDGVIGNGVVQGDPSKNQRPSQYQRVDFHTVK